MAVNISQWGTAHVGTKSFGLSCQDEDYRNQGGIWLTEINLENVRASVCACIINYMYYYCYCHCHYHHYYREKCLYDKGHIYAEFLNVRVI